VRVRRIRFRKDSIGMCVDVYSSPRGVWWRGFMGFIRKGFRMITKLFVGPSDIGGNPLTIWAKRPKKNGDKFAYSDGVYVERMRATRGVVMPISTVAVKGWQKVTIIERQSSFSELPYFTAVYVGRKVVSWFPCELAIKELPRKFWAPVRAMLRQVGA